MSRSGKFESTRDTLTSVHSLGPRMPVCGSEKRNVVVNGGSSSRDGHDGQKRNKQGITKVKQ